MMMMIVVVVFVFFFVIIGCMGKVVSVIVELMSSKKKSRGNKRSTNKNSRSKNIRNNDIGKKKTFTTLQIQKDISGIDNLIKDRYITFYTNAKLSDCLTNPNIKKNYNTLYVLYKKIRINEFYKC